MIDLLQDWIDVCLPVGYRKLNAISDSFESSKDVEMAIDDNDPIKKHQ